MDARVLAAAENNAQWCDRVCRSHGLPTALSEHMWVAQQGSPRLYPDAVTLVPGLPVDCVLRQVEVGPGCSVKDSFADLDLSAHGFTVLFDASWLFREPEPPRECSRFDWQSISTDDDLEQWLVAAGLVGIIRPELLRDPTVRVLARCNRQVVVAGAILNRTGETVGLSNVFTSENAPAAAWRDLPAAIGQAFADLPIVGYEHDTGLAAAVEVGFEAIGPLRVWLRPPA
jgi:hypothetical protein